MLTGWIAGIVVVVLGVLRGSPNPPARRGASWALLAAAFPVGWAVLHGAGAVVPGPPWLGAGLASALLHGGAALAGAWVALLLVPEPRVRAPAVPTRPPAKPPLPPSDPLADEAAQGQAGLLRVLRDGPDFHRAAAARALSIPFAGSRQRVLGQALISVVEGDAGREARAEAAVALALVFALDLDSDAHREGEPLPEGWLDAARDAVAAGG